MSPDDPLNLTPEAVAHERTADRLAETQAAAFFAALPPLTRGGAGAPLGIGRLLIQSCPDDAQKRYQTLLHFEACAAKDNDHAFLIVPACAILEGELRRLVAFPARPIADELVAALAPHPESIPFAVLDEWRRGERPFLYALVLLLSALRCGLEQERPAVHSFISAHFRPEFAALARGAHFTDCLDRIRREFRNPASHAEKTFNSADYECFARLLVAANRVGDWDRNGPAVATPDATVGILHHHLSNALAASEHA